MNSTAEGGMVADGAPHAVAYLRLLYESELAWYAAADNKAQLLLTFNGAYVVLLTGLIIPRMTDIEAASVPLDVAAVVLLAATALGATVSILAAVVCLKSRLSNSSLSKYVSQFRDGQESAIHPAVVGWFGTLAALDRNDAIALLESADVTFERQSLVRQIVLLAPNVLAKHRAVNAGWTAMACSLVLLLASAVALHL